MAGLALRYLNPFFFFSLLVFHSPSYSSLVPLCNHQDSIALLQFKNSFTLDSDASASCLEDHHQSSYPKTASWRNGTNCCLWDGVTCDTKSGHVIGLDLSCSWIRGELSPNNTLFQLSYLQRLNLALNQFGRKIHIIEGFDFFDFESPMLSEFGDLMSLTHLNLSYAGFVGVVPSKFSQLSKLVSLDLGQSHNTYNNSLTFEPSTWERLIHNATSLRALYLGNVNMSSITLSSLSSSLMNLSSSLVSLFLGGTDLQGTLTSNIFCLPNLQVLDLSWNFYLQIELPKSNWSTPLSILNLQYTSIFGGIPSSIGGLKSLIHMDLSDCNLNGHVPPSLWNLTQLIYLGLRVNNLSSEIPSSISNLQHLTFLDLSQCNFEGPISQSLWNLTQLTYLNLGSNNLGGEISSSLSNLQQLTYLDLSHNDFNGSIPNVFGKISILLFLSLEYNNLKGQLPPSLFNLTQLTDLSLGDNQLIGLISEFSTPSLERCYLSNNKLRGHIPKSIFSLLYLSELNLSSNHLSGFVDFHQFSRVPRLTILDLSNNNFLSLNFDSIDKYAFPHLQQLFLSSCNITTSFPTFLARLQNLQQLDLSHNKIHGRIPAWLNDNVSLLWKNIQLIDLSFNMLQGNVPIPPFSTLYFFASNNKFTGEIPFAICNASSLSIIDFSHNYLSGLLPQCLGTISSLSILDLQMNNFNGIMPENFSEGSVLETIKLNVNQLEGSLPLSLAHCQQLEILDLGENKLEGTFPYWLEPLQELRVLILRDNKFHGAINPLKSNSSFLKLRILDISNNFFRGHIPATYIKSFKGMMSVNDDRTSLNYMESNFTLDSYNDSVVLTVKGNDIKLERILTTFTTIDLSNNMFEGEIPEILGELNSLIGLNLSHNRIIGKIPHSLGNMKSLEWLDLSSNMLIGEIPEALTNLSFLSFLNLSENQLEGFIPAGKQFNTFQNNSYKGNPLLCGWPLSKPCSVIKEPPDSMTSQHHRNELAFGWKPVAMGYACGVIFGILIGYIVFRTGKPQWLVRAFGGESNRRVKRRRNRH